MPSQLRYFGDKIRLVLLKGAELKVFLCEHSLQLLKGHFPYAPGGYTVTRLKKALIERNKSKRINKVASVNEEFYSILSTSLSSILSLSSSLLSLRSPFHTLRLSSIPFTIFSSLFFSFHCLLTLISSIYYSLPLLSLLSSPLLASPYTESRSLTWSHFTHPC